MSAHPDQPAEHTIAAEEKASKDDPHGVGAVKQDTPKGLPSSDRHETETASG